MPFIGNQPADKFLTLEKQTFTTSATDTYSLDREVSSVNDIELFLNNVRQEPTEAYTISGTTLTLASAITSSDELYCVYQGRAIGTQAPALSSVTNDMLAGSIATSKLANQNIGFRNLIINGDMSIAQRGTSASSLTTGGYSTHDRWIRGMANAGTWTQSQDTDVPTGQGFAKSLKLDCTTASTPIAADGNLNIGMRFEGQMLQQLKYGTSNAESLTLSFWVKSTKTGTFYAEFYNFDDTRHISKSYTVNASDTWEKKTITFEGDIAGTITNDNTSSLYLLMWLAAGSNYTSGTHTGVWEATVNANRLPGQVNCADSTSNNFYLTGVQLEVGTSASDFEFLPYDVNLQRCQRYFQTYQSGGMICWSGTTISGANYFQQVRHLVQMRASATIGNFTVAGLSGFASGDPSIDYGDPLGFRATKQSNAAVNEGYFMYKYTADAEL